MLLNQIFNHFCWDDDRHTTWSGDQNPCSVTWIFRNPGWQRICSVNHSTAQSQVRWFSLQRCYAYLTAQHGFELLHMVQKKTNTTVYVYVPFTWYKGGEITMKQIQTSATPRTTGRTIPFRHDVCRWAICWNPKKVQKVWKTEMGFHCRQKRTKMVRQLNRQSVWDLKLPLDPKTLNKCKVLIPRNNGGITYITPKDKGLWVPMVGAIRQTRTII